MSPSGAVAGGPDAPSPALMSIGEVLGHLRSEFPDATISKLRFLEAEGLVNPRRTASGYRKYDWADVARLRYILAAQRDHYLPLRVIREQLEAADARDEPPGSARPAALSAVGPRRGDEPDPPGRQVRLSRADLLAGAGLDEDELGELEHYGLVSARAGGWYDADTLIVATVAAQLARYGLQPRHLRGWRAAADREVGLFAQLVAPLVRQSDPAARARAADTLRELSALSQRLHAALVRTGVRQTLGG